MPAFGLETYDTSWRCKTTSSAQTDQRTPPWSLRLIYWDLPMVYSVQKAEIVLIESSLRHGMWQCSFGLQSSRTHFVVTRRKLRDAKLNGSVFSSGQRAA